MTDWAILNVLPIGVVVINRQFLIVKWNRWMEMYSDLPAEDLVGTELFSHFPNLNKASFLRSCRTIFAFGNVVYLSQKLHQYLFPFRLFHARNEAGFEMMQQSCTMSPVRSENGEIDMIAITVEDVTDSAILEHRLRLLNNVDGLTGAYNRRFLDRRLAEEVDRHRRYDRPLSVAIFDIDHFKVVNDTYGHTEGDRVLKMVHATAAAEMRGSDFLCRYGGEEFVALMPETDEVDAREMAERIRLRIAGVAFQSDDDTYSITASFGIAALGPRIDSAEELLTLADKNLYRAKRSGRNCVIWEPE